MPEPKTAKEWAKWVLQNVLEKAYPLDPDFKWVSPVGPLIEEALSVYARQEREAEREKQALDYEAAARMIDGLYIDEALGDDFLKGYNTAKASFVSKLISRAAAIRALGPVEVP